MASLPSILDETWQGVDDRKARVLDVSPDGAFLSAQWGQLEGSGHAAVWNVATRERVWAVDGVTACVWVGEELLATRTSGSPRRESFEWYEWATRDQLGSTPATYPLGARLTHAPRLKGAALAQLACVAWVDQTEGGIEFFRRGTRSWSQVAKAGWWQDKCNFVGDPCFDERGRFLALPVGSPDGWERRDSKSCGVVIVFDTRDLKAQFLSLTGRPAAGWVRSAQNPSPEVLGFETGDRVRVRIQTGEEVSVVIDPGGFE